MSVNIPALLVLCVIWVWSSDASAHDARHNPCTSPVRPVDENNDRLWQSFLNEVDAFRACTHASMEQHQQAVVDHQAAARAAVEDWNDFVRTSLNAPEDFPWPPQEEP